MGVLKAGAGKTRQGLDSHLHLCPPSPIATSRDMRLEGVAQFSGRREGVWQKDKRKVSSSSWMTLLGIA